MKKERIYKLIENSLTSSKNSYIRYLNEFAKELKIDGYHDMFDNIKNIIDKNINIRLSSNSTSDSFLDIIDSKNGQMDVLIKGIQMGIVKSAFFYGSPGTGKTYFAKELSKICNYPFVQISISEIIDSKLGESIKRLDGFMKKNISDKKIIFLDEADSLFTKRGKANDVFEIDRLLTTMLQIMDLNREAVIIFASNLKNRIDNAILRRFDILINFDSFNINIDEALKRSKFLNEWKITDDELDELKNYIMKIQKVRISDIDIIARKYIINKHLNSKNNNAWQFFNQYINEINKVRENE